MQRILSFSLFFTMVTAGAVYANSTEEEEKIVQNFVEDLASELMQILDNEEITPEEKLMQLEVFLEPHFNFPLMARFALKRHWESMTEGETGEYVSLFRQKIVHQYITQLLDLKITGWHIRQVNVSKKETRYIVRVNTVIDQEAEHSLDIQWVLIGTDIQTLKCMDVSIDGISLLTSLQQDLKDLLRKEKNNIAGFLRLLADEIQNNL